MFELCEIAKEKEMIYLKRFVGEEIKEKIKVEKKDSDRYLLEIQKLAFNPSVLNENLDKIRKINLRNFNTPNQYYEEFEKLCKIINLCSKKEDALTSREKEVYFLRGLTIDAKKRDG